MTNNDRNPRFLEDSGNDNFPSELIKASETFEAALSNCVFRDEAQKNAVILLAEHLKMFNMVDELNGLTNFLNASVSVGGYSRVLATSAHIGLLHPSTLGVKLNKEGEKAWAEAAISHKQLKDEGNHHEE